MGAVEHEATSGTFNWRVKEMRSSGGLSDKQFIILSGDNTMIGAFKRQERANEVVTAVNAHADLVAALEAIEWSKYHIDSGGCTALCGGNRDQGHTDDCQLAAALAKGRAE